MVRSFERGSIEGVVAVKAYGTAFPDQLDKNSVPSLVSYFFEKKVLIPSSKGLKITFVDVFFRFRDPDVLKIIVCNFLFLDGRQGTV